MGSNLYPCIRDLDLLEESLRRVDRTFHPFCLTNVLLCLTNVSESICKQNTSTVIGEWNMNGKNIIIIGLGLFMMIASLSAIPGNADETQVTSDAGVSTSSAGIWYPSFGRFTYADGTATGAFVHFSIDEDTGMITGYTVKLTVYPSIWYVPYDSKSPYPEGVQFWDYHV